MTRERNNITIKILALVIAIVLWSYVMSEVNPETTEIHKNIDVTFNNVEALDKEELQIMEPQEVTISVEITGKRSEIVDFSPESIEASLDLSGYGEGEKKVPIDVKLDDENDVRISDFEPKEVLFDFDKIVSVEKPVTIKTLGELDSGYILGNLETKSEEILLKGPRTWIDNISEIVATVDLNGRKGEGSVTPPIKLLNEEGNEVEGVEVDPETVEVFVPILRTTKVPIELQIENQPPENYEITEVVVNPSNVEIKGSKDILELTTIQTKPVDINDLIKDAEMVVELDLPEGVQLLEPTEEIKVLLKIKEMDKESDVDDSFNTIDLSYTREDIEIKNLDAELFIDEEESMKDIKIRIKGNKEKLVELTNEDFKLSIDLKELKEGLNKVEVDIEGPTDIIVEEITPEPFEIFLKENES